MTPEQKAAFINAMTAGMLCELAAMQANNAASEGVTRYPPHAPAEFNALPDKHGLGHNAVVSFFGE